MSATVEPPPAAPSLPTGTDATLHAYLIERTSNRAAPAQAPERLSQRISAPVHAAQDDHPGHSIDAFECNICLDLAREPVVTLCGHLFCWGCLYKWTLLHQGTKVCPVCKAGVDASKVIPIYGRGCDFDPRPAEIVVPPRPAGQRPPVVQQPQQVQPGIFHSLFGFNFAGQGAQGGYFEALTPEQQHQAFLSRLLLMLGSFVIMCLLLF